MKSSTDHATGREDARVTIGKESYLANLIELVSSGRRVFVSLIVVICDCSLQI